MAVAALQETTGVGALHQVKKQSYLSCALLLQPLSLSFVIQLTIIYFLCLHIWHYEASEKIFAKKILGIFLVSTRSSFYFRIYSIFIAPSLVFIFVTTYLRKKICENLNECLIPFRKQSSGEAKFVRTSALNQPLVFNPHSSAHKTFKAYSSNPTDTPGRLTINNTKQTIFLSN